MYPGNATKKEFTRKKTDALAFCDRQDKNQNKTVLLAPVANTWETPELYRIVVAAPGLSREDFNIEIKDGVLYIAGQHDEATSAGNDRREYDYTDWERNFVLPSDADVILSNARYSNGELSINIPRGNTTGNPSHLPVYVY